MSKLVEFNDQDPLHHMIRFAISSADPEQPIICANKEQAALVRQFAKELRPDVTLKVRVHKSSEKPHPALVGTDDPS